MNADEMVSASLPRNGFVEEGAHFFIAGRSQQELDRAMTTIGKNVSGVLTDVSKLDDIDNLYRTGAAQKRKIDIVFANAGFVETQGNSRRHPRAFRQNLRYQRARRLFHRSEGTTIDERRRLHHSHLLVHLTQGISLA